MTNDSEISDEDIQAEFNLAIAEELIKEINPNVTLAEVEKVYSHCLGNPWNAGILYRLGYNLP